MNPSSPFPNQGEIIRYLAVAMDLKANNKDFDDYAKQGDTDFKRREKLLDEVFYARLKPSIGEKLSVTFRQAINDFLDRYIALVKAQSLDGVPRQVALPMLMSNFFAWHATQLLDELTSHINGPKSLVLLIIPKQNAIERITAWFELDLPEWNKRILHWHKEQKDLFNAWRKGSHLPSFTYIQLVPDWLEQSKVALSENDKHKIRALFMLARLVEFVKKSKLGQFTIEQMYAFKKAWRTKS